MDLNVIPRLTSLKSLSKAFQSLIAIYDNFEVPKTFVQGEDVNCDFDMYLTFVRQTFYI